jgi:hypothetical protein
MSLPVKSRNLSSSTRCTYSYLEPPRTIGTLVPKISPPPTTSRLTYSMILGCTNDTPHNVTTTLSTSHCNITTTLPSSHHNITTALPNGASANHTIPHNGTSVINGTGAATGSNSKTDTNINNGSVVGSTAATSDNNTTASVSSSVLVPAIFVPVASLVIISILLYIFRSSRKDKKPKPPTEKWMGHFESRGIYKSPVPPNKLWIPHRTTIPERANSSHPRSVKRPALAHHQPRITNHDRPVSPVSAYLPSVHDSRRSSIVSALEDDIGYPHLPSPENRQGRLLRSSFNLDQYYSHAPLGPAVDQTSNARTEFPYSQAPEEARVIRMMELASGDQRGLGISVPTPDQRR